MPIYFQMIPEPFQFYVVELTERSFTDPDKYVCIPRSWIKFRETADAKVLIKYPIEEASETKERVKKGEECSNDWKIHSAQVKLGTNSYKEAHEYIKILNKIYIQEHNSTNVVEIGVLPTLDTSSSKANDSLSNDNIETVRTQTTPGQLQQTAAEVEVKADEADFSSNAKKYFTRHRSKISSAANTVSSLDQTVKKKSQETIKCVEASSKITDSQDNKSLADKPKMLSDDDITRAAIRTALGPNAKQNLEILHAEFLTHRLMLKSLCLGCLQHCKTLRKLIELSGDDNSNDENINVMAVNDKIPGSQNNSDHDGHDNEENEDDVPSDKIRGQARKFTLPPEYDPGDSKWTLKHKEKNQGLVELTPGSHIYVNAVQLSNCKRISKDSKTLARMLLVEVFSENALSVCSLTGKRAYAYDLMGLRVRPGLDEHARNILLSYVEDYALKQKWVTFDKHTILTCLRNKIQEIRGKSMDRLD